MKIALIASGYRVANLRLQPWRYLSEIADGLRALGHQVTVFSDVEPDASPPGTISLRSIRLPATGNRDLEERIEELKPDVCLWNFGLTSALHFAPKRLRWRSFAVFTSPMYGLSEILRLGPQRLMRSREYAAIHLMGAMVPRKSLRRALAAFHGVILQSSHLVKALTDAGVDERQLHLVRPGVDDDFRLELPLPPADVPFTVLYMGSPLPIRGVFDLVDSVALIKDQRSALRLRILSRSRGEYAHHERDLRERIEQLGLTDCVTVHTGFLARTELLAELTQAHMVALPFQLVPSDVPLAILESMALGRSVLATRVASVTDYLRDGRGFLAEPAQPRSLAAALLGAVENPVELSDIRAAALAFARTFPQWPDVARKTLQLVQTGTGAPG